MALPRDVIDALNAADPDDADFALLSDRAVVSAVRARSSVNESLVYAQLVHAQVASLVRRFGGRSQALLEIGPGANLGPLFCFAAAGAQTLAAIDVAPAEPPADGFYSLLRDYLSCVGGREWWRYLSKMKFDGITFSSADAVAVDELLARIDYRVPVAAGKLPFDGASFDVVYSVAALEHVSEPAAAVSEMFRILRPGGLAVHEIDLTHHGSFDPLRFLEWTDAEYLERAAPYGEGVSLNRVLDGTFSGEIYCNRLRLSDWLASFATQPFEVLLIDPVITAAEEAIRSERLAEPFRSKTAEDLSVLAFRVVLRKPS